MSLSNRSSLHLVRVSHTPMDIFERRLMQFYKATSAIGLRKLESAGSITFPVVITISYIPIGPPHFQVFERRLEIRKISLGTFLSSEKGLLAHKYPLSVCGPWMRHKPILTVTRHVSGPSRKATPSLICLAEALRPDLASPAYLRLSDLLPFTPSFKPFLQTMAVP